MIISDHAQEEMQNADISEEEVRQCLEHGTIEITECINAEIRYGRKLVFKERAIMVVYTFRNDEERVITVYPIRKKKWQE